MSRFIAFIAGLVVATGFGSPAFGEELGFYLWLMGGQQLGENTQLTDAPITAEMRVKKSTKAARVLEKYSTLKPVAVRDGSIVVLSHSHDSLRSEPTVQDSSATFVIDFDEPAVEELVREASAQSDGKLTPEELSHFVYRHVSQKTHSRGFDIASRVAVTGEGDCTEHANLLTAMARANGYPSRVVFGVLAMESDSNVQFFGHAWSEIHDGVRWQRADATRPVEPDPGIRYRYLPIMPMTDEGPGYVMGAIERTTIWPSQVRIINAEYAEGSDPY